MKLKKLIALSISVFLFISCSSVLESLLTSIKINEHNELSFFGPLTLDNVDKLMQVYNQSDDPPTVLRINSRGGDGLAGGRLGDWVHKLKLDVKVTSRCYSACANYVFPAGRRSILGKNAMLWWHGSVRSPKFTFPGYGRLTEEEVVVKYNLLSAAELKKVRDVEKSFYRHLGIDPNLPLYGESDDYRLFHADHEYDGDYKGFYYSVDDMKAMGLNIVLLHGEWHGDDPATSRYKKCYRVVLPGMSSDLTFF